MYYSYLECIQEYIAKYLETWAHVNDSPRKDGPHQLGQEVDGIGDVARQIEEELLRAAGGGHALLVVAVQQVLRHKRDQPLLCSEICMLYRSEYTSAALYHTFARKPKDLCFL